MAQLLREPLAALGLGEVVLRSVSTVIAFIIITVLHIVLGELAPKSLAIRKAEAITLLTAAPLRYFTRLCIRSSGS